MLIWTTIIIVAIGIIVLNKSIPDKRYDYTTPKEEYEKVASKLREEDIEYNRYTASGGEIYFPSTKETFDPDVWSDWRYCRGHIGMYNKQVDKVVELEKRKAKKHNELFSLEKERIEQLREDKEYSEKLKALLKIKPLDKDLKENFRKANRIIEIGTEIQELIKEIYKLRK